MENEELLIKPTSSKTTSKVTDKYVNNPNFRNSDRDFS